VPNRHRMATDLILIRHGETDWNRSRRFQGQIDVPLNQRGQAQAQRLAERLMRERIDLIYVSDLIRTRQTAQPASHRLELVATPSAALREQGFGILEGLSAGEVVERHPAEWAGWMRFDPDYAPPGGESTRAFHSRVLAEVQALAARHPRRTVALVTHGGVLDMLWRTALGRPLAGARECPIPNAGLNRMRLCDDALEVLEWADDAHVADLVA
jgi:2,3-bisphosphoglycerate-dependent phosphoglycerate mutase